MEFEENTRKMLFNEQEQDIGNLPPYVQVEDASFALESVAIALQECMRDLKAYSYGDKGYRLPTEELRQRRMEYADLGLQMTRNLAIDICKFISDGEMILVAEDIGVDYYKAGLNTIIVSRRN